MKIFRKTVCLAVAIIFAFAPMVSAADVCSTCKSTNNELIYSKDQGNCTRIEYENDDGFRDGYNTRSQNFNAKVILDLCACPAAAKNYFKVNRILGLRLTILTDGVYWTNESVAIQPFAANAAVCSAGYAPNPNVNYELVANDGDNYELGDVVPNANNRNGTVYLPRIQIDEYNTRTGLREDVPSPGYVNRGPQGTQCLDIDNDPTTPCVNVTNPRAGIMTVLDNMTKFHKSNDLTKAGFWLYEDATVNPGLRSRAKVDYEYYLKDYQTTVTGDNLLTTGTPVKCAIPAAKRAQIVQISNAYQIGMLEEEYNLCKWWVDIPEMRKDNSVIKPMDELKVKIEVIGDDPGGLCAESQAICECTVTLGVFGADKYTMYFPYVLTQSDPWTSGIAVTNVGQTFTAVDDMEADFFLTDSKGREFTFNKKDFQSAVWTTMIDALLDKFEGGTPAAGAAWLKIEANFPVDGYEFISDGVFGAGTQPRIYDLNRIRSEKVYKTD